MGSPSLSSLSSCLGSMEFFNSDTLGFLTSSTESGSEVSLELGDDDRLGVATGAGAPLGPLTLVFLGAGRFAVARTPAGARPRPHPRPPRGVLGVVTGISSIPSAACSGSASGSVTAAGAGTFLRFFVTFFPCCCESAESSRNGAATRRYTLSVDVYLDDRILIDAGDCLALLHALLPRLLQS